MKNIRIYFGLAIFAFIACLPQTSSAYETVGETAALINKNTILYTITYHFGFINRDTYMSTGAKRGVENASSSPFVGYEILDNGKVSSEGEVKAMILSKARIKNNLYYLPKGKAGDFRLVAILTLPDNANLDNKKLKINHLPVVLVDDKKKAVVMNLKDSELETYITPAIR